MTQRPHHYNRPVSTKHGKADQLLDLHSPIFRKQKTRIWILFPSIKNEASARAKNQKMTTTAAWGANSPSCPSRPRGTHSGPQGWLSQLSQCVTVTRWYLSLVPDLCHHSAAFPTGNWKKIKQTGLKTHGITKLYSKQSPTRIKSFFVYRQDVLSV